MWTDKCTWRRFWFLLVVTLFLVALGFCEAEIEDMHVGYTHSFSLCVFCIAALSLYFTLLVAVVLLWRRFRRPRASEKADGPKESPRNSR